MWRHGFCQRWQKVHLRFECLQCLSNMIELKWEVYSAITFLKEIYLLNGNRLQATPFYEEAPTVRAPRGNQESKSNRLSSESRHLSTRHFYYFIRLSFPLESSRTIWAIIMKLIGFCQRWTNREGGSWTPICLVKIGDLLELLFCVWFNVVPILIMGTANFEQDRTLSYTFFFCTLFNIISIFTDVKEYRENYPYNA